MIRHLRGPEQAKRTNVYRDRRARLGDPGPGPGPHGPSLSGVGLAAPPRPSARGPGRGSDGLSPSPLSCGRDSRRTVTAVVSEASVARTRHSDTVTVRLSRGAATAVTVNKDRDSQPARSLSHRATGRPGRARARARTSAARAGRRPRSGRKFAGYHGYERAAAAPAGGSCPEKQPESRVQRSSLSELRPAGHRTPSLAAASSVRNPRPGDSMAVSVSLAVRLIPGPGRLRYLRSRVGNMMNLTVTVLGRLWAGPGRRARADVHNSN